MHGEEHRWDGHHDRSQARSILDSRDSGTVVSSKAAAMAVLVKLIVESSIILSATVRHTRHAIMLVKTIYVVVSS